jgi:hypothetical protein
MNKRPVPRPRWYRPCAERLEDRTLLSVGDGLNTIFGNLQLRLNAHLLQPSVAYSLPMVGQNLGRDAQSQFLHAIGTAVQNVTDPANLQPAIPANSGTVTVNPPGGSQTDYEIQIMNAQLTLRELFNPGLPGLTTGNDPLTTLVGRLTNTVHVNVNLTYNLQLFFVLDGSGNVALDTAQNSPTTPLLALNITAHLDASDLQSLTEPLGPLTVDVTDNGSAFTAALQFNGSGIVMQNAQANIDLALAVNSASAPNFPGLESDLNVLWNLSNTTNPFDALANDPQQPTIGFDVGVDLVSVGNWLNNTLLSQLAQKLQFLQPTIDTINSVLTTPIPIVGSIIPNGHTLEDLLANYTSVGKGVPSQIAAFITPLEAILNGTEAFTQFTGGSIPLASVELPVTASADPRLASLNLGPVVDHLTPPSPSKQAQGILSSLNLPGSFQLPLLANSLGDLQALLLDENVVLVQWQLPSLSISANTTIGPFPIFPPLAIALQLGFGIDGGLTIGYDTYGLTTTTPTMVGWDQDPTNLSVGKLAEGVFIADARMELTGSIGLSAEADLGVAQVGGTGSFNLSFGIQGINDSGQGSVDLTGPPPPPTLGAMSYPYHTVPFAGKQENVLQWGDIKYDGTNGPLCPFQIGGTLSIGLSVFVTVGFSPFSVTFTYDLGNITIASFNVNTCSGTSNPHLAASDIKGDDVGQLLANDGLATQSEIDSLFQAQDPKYPGTQHWILLYLGDFGGDRDVQDNLQYPPKTETFEVTPDRTQSGLLVQAFGQQEDFANLNAGTTTILAFGDPNGKIPVNLTVDQGVHANTYFAGGPVANHVNYQGSGISRLLGGTAENTFIGGSGFNTLFGGDGSSTDPKSNVLVGGPGQNMMFGGLASATLVAGPKNGDFLAASQHGTGTYILSAGAGDATMYGSPTGYTRFQWVQGDGNLTILPNIDSDSDGLGNELDALGSNGGESWTISQGPDDRGLVATPGGKTITTYGVVTYNIDSSDRNNDGGDTYTVNDLSTTGIQNVNLNVHEQANPDNKTDQIIVNAPATQDTVQIDWDEDKAGPSQGQSTVYAPLTHVALSSALGNGQSANYIITTAVSKLSDSLTVNTGPAADTLNIAGTQPGVPTTQPGGQVFVNSGAGNDQFDVGFFGQLDQFQGPLTVDAGTDHNDITFDESASHVQDSVTLTASQLIRYSQPPTVTWSNSDGTYTETAYPLVINYKATGGSFFYGTSFNTSGGGTNLSIPETGNNTAVLVNGYGYFNGAHDAITVGYDAAWPTGQTQVVVDGQTLSPQFPTGVAGSTLAHLRSGIGVVDNTGTGPTLEIDDEAATLQHDYLFTATSSSALGLLDRSGAPEIGYAGSGLSVTLNAANHGNKIDVLDILQGTSATVNTGNGKNTIQVGGPGAGLDNIAGPLTINGGTGSNTLLLDDAAGTASETYELTANQLHREANATTGDVHVHFIGMANVSIHASNKVGTNVITVHGTPSGASVAVDPGKSYALLTVEDLDDTQGALTFSWTTGEKSLSVNDRSASANATYTLTSAAGTTNLQRSGAALLTLTGALTDLFLSPGRLHDNLVKVMSIAAGTYAGIFAGKRNNNIVVSPSQSLDTIAGSLSIEGQPTTQVILNDQKAASGRGYTLTASRLTFNPSLAPLTLDTVGTVTLNAGPAATTAVQGTDPATTVKLQLGTGSNHVTVGSAGGGLSAIQGPLIVNGKTGNDPLVLEDRHDALAITYTIGPNSVATTASASIQFANMGSVTLNGDKGVAEYQVTGVPAKTPITINGQGIDSSLMGPDQVNLWTITKPNAGTLDKRIMFNNVGSLIGNGHSDDFVFQSGSALTGYVGGGAAGTLDFSNYGQPVAAVLNVCSPQGGFIGTIGPLGEGFLGIQTLIGDAGSTLDGSTFTGAFDSTFHASGFAPFTLNVPDDFGGALTATSISSLFIGGNFTGQILVTKSMGTFTAAGTQAKTSHVWLANAGGFALTDGTPFGQPGKTVLVGQAASSLATITGASVGDATLVADVTDSSGTVGRQAGIVARVSPTADSYYLAGFKSTGSGFVLNIWRYQNGTLTPLATGKALKSGSGTLKFQLTGSTLHLYLNGVLTTTATDTALTTGGVGVLGGNNTVFANVTAA